MRPRRLNCNHAGRVSLQNAMLHAVHVKCLRVQTLQVQSDPPELPSAESDKAWRHPTAPPVHFAPARLGWKRSHLYLLVLDNQRLVERLNQGAHLLALLIAAAEHFEQLLAHFQRRGSVQVLRTPSQRRG
jgi:hypothetical protein